MRAQCCAHLLRLRWGTGVLEKGRQGTKRSKIDVRSIRDAPARADHPVEHPRRNLQPTMQRLSGKGAAEKRCILLLDHLVDRDLPPSPGMPWVKKLALKTGPVGVPSSSCTTRFARTAPSAIRCRYRSSTAPAHPIRREPEPGKSSSRAVQNRGAPQNAGKLYLPAVQRMGSEQKRPRL